jgi:hypothetical protein
MHSHTARLTGCTLGPKCCGQATNGGWRCTQELEKEVHLVQGFFDTPLLLWALKRTPCSLDHVYFERNIGMNRHFLQV